MQQKLEDTEVFVYCFAQNFGWMIINISTLTIGSSWSQWGSWHLINAIHDEGDCLTLCWATVIGVITSLIVVLIFKVLFWSFLCKSHTCDKKHWRGLRTAAWYPAFDMSALYFDHISIALFSHWMKRMTCSWGPLAGYYAKQQMKLRLNFVCRFILLISWCCQLFFVRHHHRDSDHVQQNWEEKEGWGCILS
jgi:hypothetical protein